MPILIAALIACSGAPGEAAPDEAPSAAEVTSAPPSPEALAADPIDYAAQIQPIWDAWCVGCHVGAEDGRISLFAGRSYDALTGPGGQVEGMSPVEPGDPSASYLLYKLDGAHLEIGGEGTMMPPHGPIPDEDRALIEAWIAAGAPP